MRRSQPKEFVREPQTLMKRQQLLDKHGHIIHPHLPRIDDINFNDVINYIDIETNQQVAEVLRAQSVYKRSLRIMIANVNRQ